MSEATAMSQDRRDRTGYRTRMAGTLDAESGGETVRLTGWVHRRRDLGGLVFVDLRDRSGLLQLSFDADYTDTEALERAHRLGSEDVIQVEGVVTLRPPEARNPELATGEVELQVRSLTLLNRARTPAIPVYRASDEELPAEELRLRHRHLDLRRPELQENLALRHRLVLAARNVLDRNGFLEIETPILTKPTPEGARDYIVPSRVHPGEFYALPQSPQIYKQILMTAGYDRYFQIARCFRDEDLRADRQPEFTQIDLEAAFVEPEDIFRWVEELMETLARQAGRDAQPPFPRITHAQAMERYGTDRPDLRFELEIRDWTEALADSESNILRGAVKKGGRIRGLAVPGGAALSRREVEGLEGLAKAQGAPGLFWTKVQDDGASGPLSRFLPEGFREGMGVREGDLVLLAAGPDSMTSPALAAVRAPAVRAAGGEEVRRDAWLWVTDFPLFERDEERGVLIPGHHPFVQPHPGELERLETAPERVGSLAYDLVYNGAELGSGSVRIHDAGLQRRVLQVLGLSDEEIQRKFGFLLEALESGAPPHGGIALGMDRIAKDFVGAASLRDVIAFPKTTAARALYEGAPSPVTPEELEGLKLKVQEGGRGPDGSETA